MDAPFVQGEENTLLDVLENSEPNTDSILINESLSEEIKRSLSTLTEREREIIVLFFGLGTNHPLSLEEIGEKFNLTRERVRQIKDKALQRLRHTSRSKILKSYLGLTYKKSLHKTGGFCVSAFCHYDPAVGR